MVLGPIDSTKKQIRNLLLVTGSALVSAIALVGLMLFFYSPSGRYSLSNTLIKPDLVDHLSFFDKNSRTGGRSRFIFEGIHFSYYDQHQWRSIPVDLASYTHFYTIIASEKSLLSVTDNIVEFFTLSPSTLVINVRTESFSEWQRMTKMFQQVQFADQGDYFRVELREQSKTGQWAYFYYPKIAEIALETLAKK